MKLGMRRTIAVVLGSLLQIGFYILVMYVFIGYFAPIRWLFFAGAILFILYVLKNSTNLSSDLPYVLLIAIVPIFGVVLYLALRRSYTRSKTFKSIQKEEYRTMEYSVKECGKIEKEIEKKDRDILRYFNDYLTFPVYKKNKIDYYPLGDDFYPVLLDELKKAKSFIFMEYFIVNHGVMFDGILEILKEKAADGVDVRFMFDDAGSIMLHEKDMVAELESYGIKAIAFNKMVPLVGVFMNNRDHRKITVIDGKVAFSGGVNLSDEYINVNSPHGHWKDNGIRIKGEAVWGMSLIFLTHWNAYTHEDSDYYKFKVDKFPATYTDNGYTVPYACSPLADYISVGEDTYIHILNHAKRYCYIMSPYLIIDNEMINTLILAVKRGVDVRIIVPGVPDKKLVYDVTASYFEILVQNGIKIYTYTPGFVHSKVFVSDDHIATVGTVNMDYRSLYLHFENGIYMEDVDEIKNIKKDTIETMAKCHEVTLAESKTGFFKSIFTAALRLFAPLM